MKSFIRIEHLSRHFGKQKVLDDINLSFGKKGMIVILGASGSGKSTLLNILSGLDIGYQGNYWIGKKSFKAMREKKRLDFRLHHIGYLFQSFNLLELETSIRNVLLPLEAISTSKAEKRKRRAKDLLCFSNMEEKANQETSLLSGGEKQRVALSRALSNEAELILADEPTGALDEKNGIAVFSILKNVSKRKLVIVVTHDRKLAEQYADKIIEIKHGKAVQIPIKHLESGEALLPSSELEKGKRHCHLPATFIYQHAFHLLKRKKFRSLISISAICLGLIGLATSLYVSNSIESEVNNAFDSIFASNQIVMSPLHESNSTLSNIISAPKEDVVEISKEYSKEVKDYGVSYICDFEENFPDKNEAYVIRGYSRIELPSISIRTVGEYLWLDDYPDLTIYPRSPKQMENDSIVLGLPYSTMFNLCFGLTINRSYISLGNYIGSRGLKLIFDLANRSWGYEDQQIFKVVGVTSSNAPTIYHLNHRWSSYVFEESMLIPSSDEIEIPISAPWTMNKVYYLEAMDSIEEMLASFRENRAMNSYIFERSNSNYDYTHCPLGENCSLERCYVYTADKNSIPYQDIEEIANSNSKIAGTILTTGGSYFASSSSLACGFIGKFFLSEDYEMLDQVIDAYSDVSLSETNADFSLPDGIYDLNYLKSLVGGVKISNDLSELSVKPVGEEEIALSSALAKKLGNPNEISVAAEVSSSENENRHIRDFRKGKLKVVSIKENDKDILYIPKAWTVDFFRDILGMSSFALEVTGAVFEIQSKSELDSMIATLSKQYPDYLFSSPSSSISSSIESTTEYISFVLGCFSLVALTISLFLFLIVMAIAVFENQAEARLLYVLGISRKDIARVFGAMSNILSFVSFLLSSLAILLLEYVVHYYIGLSFSTNSSFQISYWPIGAIFLVSFGIGSLFSSVIKAYFGKKMLY